MAGLIGDIAATLSSPTGTVWLETEQGGTSKKWRAIYATTADPGVNDDSGDLFAVGSVWINTSTGARFVCTDNTAGAAVWKQTQDHGAILDALIASGATTIATLKDALNDAVGKGRRVLSQSGAAGSAHTGTTSETALLTTTIAANALGANGRIVGELKLARTGAGGAVTIQARLGGIGGDILALVSISAANASSTIRFSIENANSTSAQLGAADTVVSFANSANAHRTGSQDTTAAKDLVITATLANSGDSVTLKAHQISIERG